jgi:hypothetical protein
MSSSKKERRVLIYGMEGRGPTLTAAKQDARQKLANATLGHYRPWYCIINGHYMIVWRELDGWTYQIVWPKSPRVGYSGGYESGGGSFEEVQRRGVRHLVRCVYADTTQIPKELADILGESGLHELAEYWQWHRRYVEGIQRGLSDLDARDYASGLHRLPAPADDTPPDPGST